MTRLGTHTTRFSEAGRAIRCGTVGGNGFGRLMDSAHVERLAPEAVLWHDGMECPRVGLVVDGYLRFQRYGRDGRRQVLSLLGPGDLFGQEAEGRIGYTLEAATEAALCCFDRARFDRLSREDRGLRQALYRQGAEHLERLRWLTWTIGALHPDERVAAFLISATGFLPFRPLPQGGGVLSLEISRRDIADLLATTPETLCRVLKGLEREGLIRMIDPAHIHVRNLSHLANRAAIPKSEIPHTRAN